MTVATGISTNQGTCGDQAKFSVTTLLNTSTFDCSSDRIEAPAGQVIVDAYVNTAYAQDTVVTGGSFAMRLRSNGSAGTVSGQLFYVNTSGTRTFIGTAVTSGSINSEANHSLNLSSQSATVPAGSKLGFRLASNGPEFRWFWGSSYGANGGTLTVTEVSVAGTTTLGTGSDPGATTIAPGASAIAAGAFTFQTNSGTDTITAVAVTLAAGSSTALSAVSISNGAATLGSVSSPSSDVLVIPLTTAIAATSTSSSYTIRIAPKSHVTMPAPPGSSYGVTAYVSGWTGTNAHAGNDTPGAMVTIDNLSPAQVGSATAIAGNRQATLTWTLPSDADLGHVLVLRRPSTPVSDLPTEGATYVVGQGVGMSTVACVSTTPAASCIDTGLANGTSYHYRIFSRDTSGNYAAGTVPAGSPTVPLAGVLVSPSSGLTTTEAGGTASFTLALASQPTADVIVPLSSSDSSEGSVSPATLTFTSANWNLPQAVVVTGVDDAIADGTMAYAIVTAATVSSDAGYNGLDVSDVSVSTIDNDVAGFTVTPTTGLVTSEAGTIATFTVRLTSEPTAPVTIGVTSSNTSEATVAPSTLAFSSTDWSTPKSVSVTGVDDFIVDGNRTLVVQAAAAISSDAGYAGLDPPDVSFTNTDDDAVGITVTPTSGLTTTESGGLAMFTIVLNSQPTADVTLTVSSADASEGTVGSETVTFTPTSWNVPLTSTVTGVDDSRQDGPQLYSVVIGPASSVDSMYDDIDPTDVTVTNADDDVAGVLVTPTGGLTTTETGGTATFSVLLTAQPLGDVTIALASDTPTEGSVSPHVLTFTSADWNTPQVVTVTGLDDSLADGDVSYVALTSAAVSIDPAYDAVDPPNVAVTNLDNDVAGAVVSSVGGIITSESGGTASFTVALSTQPSSLVSMSLSTSDASEAGVLPSTLTFTSANWHVPQTVTVIGQDDDVRDGDVAFSIITSPMVSVDPRYAGHDPVDLAALNLDNDQPGILVSPMTGLTTTEAGGAASFTVVLAGPPTADVLITLTSSDDSEGTVDPGAMTFTTASWNVPQTVLVTGADDSRADGSRPYVIVTSPAMSLDSEYAGLDAADVSLVNVDNDVPGVTVTPTSGVVTSERGQSSNVQVVLNTQPSADVTVDIASSDPSEATVSPSRLTFTPADWDRPLSATVTGVDDAMADQSQSFVVITGPTLSDDASYAGINPPDIDATNLDDDTAGIAVTARSGLVTSERGGLATFTIALSTAPSADVTLTLASSRPEEGASTPERVRLTMSNWREPQLITVVGRDDRVVDGARSYTIITSRAQSDDPSYAGIDPLDVSVTNLDDDADSGIEVIAPSNPLLTAGSAATLAAVLRSRPVAVVRVPVTPTDSRVCTVAPDVLVFTSDDWDVPDAVTVKTAADDITMSMPCTVAIGPATSGDVAYDGLTATSVRLMVLPLETSSGGGGSASVPESQAGEPSQTAGAGSPHDSSEPTTAAPPSPASMTSSSDGVGGAGSAASVGNALSDEPLGSRPLSAQSDRGASVSERNGLLAVASTESASNTIGTTASSGAAADSRVVKDELPSAQASWPDEPVSTSPSPADMDLAPSSQSGRLPSVRGVNARTTVADVQLVMSSRIGNVITVWGAANSEDVLAVALEARHGTVSLSRIDGLEITSGRPFGSRTMVFVGAPRDINRALDGLTFLPEPGFSGLATLCLGASYEADLVVDGSTPCAQGIEGFGWDRVVGARLAVRIPITVTPRMTRPPPPGKTRGEP